MSIADKILRAKADIDAAYDAGKAEVEAEVKPKLLDAIDCTSLMTQPYVIKQVL